MTPYEIGIVLHYYARVDDHEDIIRNPPVWRPTIEQFLADDILELETDQTWERTYRLTGRGHYFVDALQKVPLPIRVWVMPVVS